ncbi:VOC family protein [Jannaschia sp. M317]|uniref:VOC family protein n=1 Tax=Jannaschia sp. M317 TaxID=2867011 RepID=UPI0021A68E64|nr:VOC family protein [Jannaschia sp. M317]UWQ16267.1 VOC family protein [Jannaschia sp. M317]
MTKLAHSMIRVLEEARSVAFYEAAFGLKIVGRFPFDGFTLIYMASEPGGFELELTINDSQTEPYDLGDGYGHLALVVDDLEDTHARLTDMGAAPRKIVDFDRDGAPFARFFFVADPDGYQIEVMARLGRFT